VAEEKYEKYWGLYWKVIPAQKVNVILPLFLSCELGFYSLSACPFVAEEDNINKRIIK
jgi:hypothetical protein